MPFSSFPIRSSSLEALDKLDILEPTPIQSAAIPVLLAGRDIIAQAVTGSGKTLAFGLPLIEKINAESLVPQAMVLTPTRELAQQVGDVLAQLARPAGLSVVVIYGGVGYEPQIEALRRGAQIVVGTPGRILDHLSRGALRLGTLRLLVLDEADQMLDRGFAPDVERIIAQTPASRQTALFSATTPDWVHKVAAKALHEPEVVRVGESIEAAPEIEHSVIEVWSGDKLPILLALLDQPMEGATLVFGRTKHGVMNLERRLSRLGYEVEALQGNLSQPARDRIVKGFKEGKFPVLLATNVAARGLDMLNIERVINYDLPETTELFVHRVGRTGRMGRIGQATTIIDATGLQMIQQIERQLGKKFPRIPAAQVLARASAPRPVPARAPVAPVAMSPAMEGEPAAAPRRRRRRRPRTAPAGLAEAIG